MSVAPHISAEHRPRFYAVESIRIEPNIVLAPMEGVTDIAFRRLIRSIGGVGLTCTEFIASKGIASGKATRLWRTASLDPDERPVACQIFGNEPEYMAEAARRLEAHGATIIDLNMGCPSKKVCQNSGGSALMKDPRLAVEIVRTVRAAVAVPVTVKMRSGFDDQQRNAPELAWRFQEEGAAAVTIHWRTRADGYKGQRSVDAIADAVRRLSIPVIGNGDIVDIPSARAMLDDTGCAGLMVGRGAVQNPWLMLQITQWLAGDEPHKPDFAERQRALLTYFDHIDAAYEGRPAALGRMKMVVRYFASALPNGQALKQAVLRAQSKPQAYAAVRGFFGATRAACEGS